MNVPASAFETVHVFQYATTATVCLVVYEYLIKFDVEIRYLWRRRLTFGTALMAICWYLPFINIFQLIVYTEFTNTDPSRCITGFRLAASFIYIEFVVSTLVLFTRAYAVWGGNKYILSLLTIIYAGIVGGSSYTIFLSISNAETPSLGIPIPCLYILGDNDLWITLVLLLFSESLALGLLLIKSVQHARALRDFKSPLRSWSILAVMARDGIGYYVCTMTPTSSVFFVFMAQYVLAPTIPSVKSAIWLKCLSFYHQPDLRTFLLV
ncbi:hypothetical protein SCHPADRAFT_946178 [Schizopora paradoxa]|uniref:DUF6533 domain-containing protein n=1 Tax=Schizopora paradoxa TaxID=27342 RepID=A0A0H2RA06_9AGAM|nr:hypothetical protein SCHPADRAFT_946178 [Schizopora paradoxa]